MVSEHTALPEYYNITRFSVGDGPRGVCFDGEHIWVSDLGQHTVHKLCTTDGEVLGSYPLGTAPYNICCDVDNIWATSFMDDTVKSCILESR
jgi:hypothetical protein